MGVSQVSLSTPAVLPPEFDVTRLTANALAENELIKMRWRDFTFPMRFAFRASTILTCSLRTSFSHDTHLMVCHAVSAAEDAHSACASSNCRFFIYTSSTFHFVANYLMEVCPLSRGVMSQPLSPPLQRGIRFLHRHLPTSRSVALAIDLPVPIMR